MGRRSWGYWLAGALAVLVTAGVSAQQAEHAGVYAQADIQYGATVYSTQCTQCHGPTGDQVAGVDLRSGRFRKAETDDDLRRIVTQGIPGTSMPGRRLDPPEITGIIAFVRNMRDFNASTVMLGDRARGRTKFEEAKCLTCHQVNGVGSHLGPDLTEIGRSRPAGTLQQSLTDPTSRMLPINRPVRIVTKDGKTINGRRLNEDTFTVQLIDDQERLLSLAKADLREYTILKTSAMPSYKDQLNAQEMADLLAYLVSLKGR